MNHRAFQDQLAQFPANAANILQQLIHQQGCLDPEQVNELQGLMELPSEDLLKALLPLAAAMSTCPISHFSVGAIVEGFAHKARGLSYLGANLEIAGQPLKNGHSR